MRKTLWAVIGSVVCLAAAPARADNWDTATDTDNGSTTENALVHGSDQYHDLAAVGGVADEDWFRAVVPSRSSFQVVLDGTSGDVGAPIYFERVTAAGLVVQPAQGVGYFNPALGASGGGARTVNWENPTAAAAESFLRVRSAVCTTTCDADEVYMVRAYDTTYSIPRFNNSSTQVTVLQIANPTDASVAGTIWFYDSAGAILGNSPFTLAPRALLVLNTSGLGFASGKSGSVTVSHNARYGFLAGKAVAVEPATGFTFDTPMLPRPL